MTMGIESLPGDRRALWPVAGVLVACVLGVGGCATESPAYRNQRTFENPTSAVQSLVAAARYDDTSELEEIFGPDGREILSSGDPVMDRRHREVFVVAMDQGWSLEKMSGGARELVVGHEQWPFPIPLVKDSRGWWFDTAAGEWEILARRIGRNELAVIGSLRTYVLAQRDFAGQGHDGKPAGTYARRFRSDPGRHDGLYWSADAPGDEPSPLSRLAAEAAAEGYTDEPSEGPRPFYGYFFRILTRQGRDAPGGARSYLVNGDMTGGFAAVAYPAEYENSGIMTFLVGQDGVVFESDLGDDTLAIASEITEYNPDGNWHRVE
jgi:hypothetical protein